MYASLDITHFELSTEKLNQGLTADRLGRLASNRYITNFELSTEHFSTEIDLYTSREIG
jgi:hypothetical protein